MLTQEDKILLKAYHSANNRDASIIMQVLEEYITPEEKALLKAAFLQHNTSKRIKLKEGKNSNE